MTTITFKQSGDGPITREGTPVVLIDGTLVHTIASKLLGTARVQAEATGSVSATWKEQLYGVEYVAKWEREPDATFSLDAVVDGLQKHGIPAYVEQTGGGCATIYAGGMHVHEEMGDRWNAWNVAAGPGHFTGPGWTSGVAYLCEFNVGPNDDGATPSVSLPDSITRADDAVEWAVEHIRMAVAVTADRTHADWNRAA